MRCLVTGAYGFIGSEVIAALRREGLTVIGCGRDLELARRVKKEPGLAFAGGSRALSGSKCEQSRYCELSARSLFSPTIICCSSSV